MKFDASAPVPTTAQQHAPRQTSTQNSDRSDQAAPPYKRQTRAEATNAIKVYMHTQIRLPHASRQQILQHFAPYGPGYGKQHVHDMWTEVRDRYAYGMPPEAKKDLFTYLTRSIVGTECGSSDTIQNACSRSGKFDSHFYNSKALDRLVQACVTYAQDHDVTETHEANLDAFWLDLLRQNVPDPQGLLRKMLTASDDYLEELAYNGGEAKVLRGTFTPLPEHGSTRPSLAPSSTPSVKRQAPDDGEEPPGKRHAPSTTCTSMPSFQAPGQRTDADRLTSAAEMAPRQPGASNLGRPRAIRLIPTVPTSMRPIPILARTHTLQGAQQGEGATSAVSSASPADRDQQQTSSQSGAGADTPAPWSVERLIASISVDPAMDLPDLDDMQAYQIPGYAASAAFSTFSSPPEFPFEPALDNHVIAATAGNDDAPGTRARPPAAIGPQEAQPINVRPDLERTASTSSAQEVAVPNFPGEALGPGSPWGAPGSPDEPDPTRPALLPIFFGRSRLSPLMPDRSPRFKFDLDELTMDGFFGRMEEATSPSGGASEAQRFPNPDPPFASLFSSDASVEALLAHIDDRHTPPATDPAVFPNPMLTPLPPGPGGG